MDVTASLYRQTVTDSILWETFFAAYMGILNLCSSKYMHKEAYCIQQEYICTVTKTSSWQKPSDRNYVLLLILKVILFWFHQNIISQCDPRLTGFHWAYTIKRNMLPHDRTFVYNVLLQQKQCIIQEYCISNVSAFTQATGIARAMMCCLIVLKITYYMHRNVMFRNNLASYFYKVWAMICCWKIWITW
jgi:hypothetical protein